MCLEVDALFLGHNHDNTFKQQPNQEDLKWFVEFMLNRKGKKIAIKSSSDEAGNNLHLDYEELVTDEVYVPEDGKFISCFPLSLPYAIYKKK